MKSKSVIINYLESLPTTGHLEKADTNRIILSAEPINYSALEGCPSSFGPSDYEGLCSVRDNNRDLGICARCWEKALTIQEGDINEEA